MTVIKALETTLKLKMYQPIGCSQFQRDLKAAIKAAEQVLKELHNK